MAIYLNEFPFGGGIALLDALSAGLPLVSMHDESGPPQAKYAGAYFGMDRVVRSCRPEEYVDLACRLLENPEMLAEWRAAALAKYEAHTDTKRYVRRFEEIVEEWIAVRGR
jgi:glycosyltransferase involved in cell wall biosynthesis